VNYYWLLDGNAMEMRGPIQYEGPARPHYPRPVHSGGFGHG
jgi:hypothetical protein